MTFHAEYSWNNQGPIPLVSLAREYLSQGLVICETPAIVAVSRHRPPFCAASTARLWNKRISRLARSTRTGAAKTECSAKSTTVEAFSYTEPGSRLELFTEPLVASGITGIVREAILTTLVDHEGTLLNRLRLFVNLGEARSLDFAMPRWDLARSSPT